MSNQDTLNQSIDNAKRHYRSMFTLPMLRTAFAVVFAVSLLVGVLSYLAVPTRGLIWLPIVGLSFFALAVVANLIVSRLVLRNDRVFQLRRTLFLSVVGIAFWLLFMILGDALSVVWGGAVWVKLSLLGFAVVITLNIIVFKATSDASVWRRGLAVLLQPVLCLVPLLIFWNSVSGAGLLQVLPFVVLAPVVALAVGLLFFYPIERMGKAYSISSIPLFKAFIADWVTGENAPLEKMFEDMGEDADVKVDVLKFEADKPKAAVILSHVHPGPFSNIGSSLLPSMMKHGFQKECNCEACTPLGLLGHELDLASQASNQKIVAQVVAEAGFKASGDLASPFVRASEGVASASCQIFGDTAFLSFTLAPETTEDMPQELGTIVAEEAAKQGLQHAVVVNTHNSLTNVVDVAEHVEGLRTVASRCFQEAVAKPKSPFRVGAASVYPQEFTLKDGMGSGGITALVVEVQGEKTAYVVIDGNNMVSGLRERLLAALAEAGFGSSEVFTTDTHAVSAISSGRRLHRGYHPVGEAMDQARLTKLILDTAKKAEANLEVATAGCIRLVVPKVRTIGEARLKSMTTLVDEAIQRIKKIVIPVFGLEGLILVLMLLFL